MIHPNRNIRFSNLGGKTGQKWITNLTFVLIPEVPYIAFARGTLHDHRRLKNM